jgi:hypothetical protein
MRTASTSKILLGSILLAWLGACAFTVHDVRVDYVYREPVAIDLSDVSERIRIGPFEDNRGNPNPRMIMNAQNGHHQTTTGGWQAEEPIAEIVRDGIAQGLAADHATLVDSSESLVLTGEVLDYHYLLEEQFWSGTVRPLLTVKLRLSDATSGATVWRQSFTGSTSYHGSFMPAAEMLFRGSLDDLVKKIASGRAFADVLRNRAQTK